MLIEFFLLLCIVLSIGCAGQTQPVPPSPENNWNDPSSPASANGTDWCRGYEDKDGDGYGTGPELVFHCPLPAGYVATADDCADLDPRVFPGQTEYSFDPAGNFNETGHYSWDFDCNGLEEPRWPSSVQWVGGAVPNCGDVGELVYVGVRDQECR